MNIRTTLIGGVLTASVAALMSPAGAQTMSPDESSHPAITVYVQVADARFDSYLLLRKAVSAGGEADGPDELFYIPSPTSKERERESAGWRRRFNLIVSAATLSERVQSRISQIKEEYRRADRAAECWTVDSNKERRITITIIGSASDAAIESEYQAVSRDFFANPRSFTCKYTSRIGTSTPGP
jgi:hypothetical protein